MYKFYKADLEALLLPPLDLSLNSSGGSFFECGWKKIESSAIDLQWFASAEDEGRTEQPSEHKLRKAREEGRVAKSMEVGAAAVLLAAVLVLAFLASFMLKTIAEMIRFFLLRAVGGEIEGGFLFRVFIHYFALLAAPIMFCSILVALIANVVQMRGFVFSTKLLKPQFNKVLPHFGRFFKRALFSAEGIFNLAKSLVKIAVLVTICYFVIRSSLPRMSMMLESGFYESVAYIASSALKLLLISAVFFLVISVADFIFQKRQFIESMKMSRQEVKEEYKELEGDPLVKGRMKQRMREILSRNMALNVPKADVVITNPTHYAVAVQYDRLTMSAPTVIAKGQDHMALKIKEIAIANDVPVMENKPLARALYSQVEIGDMIPPEYFQAMAVIFSKVLAMDSKKRSSMLREEA